MGAICASDRRRTMGSFMRWRSTKGAPTGSVCHRARLTRDGRVVTNTDYPALEKLAESAVKDKQKFERLLVSKENLLEMFSVR